MSQYPEVGKVAPKFTAPAVGGEYGDGESVKLQDLRGRPVVLYFYPKDDTPGCTKQACGIRDHWAELSAVATVLGISVDSPAKHRKFIDKYELPFALVSDEDKSIVETYGVWVEKSMYGRKFMGTERSTFLIDAKGRLAAVFPKVKPAAHVDVLLEALAELS